MRIRSLIVATLASGVFATAAVAADSGFMADPIYDSPLFSFDGVYVGVQAGGQWMWTPAIERDRRIALQDRSTRFFGTDFSFEDLEERDAAQYEHKLLGEEVLAGTKTWKIQAVPKPTRSSQYTKNILWIRTDNYATVRIDSYEGDQVVRRLDHGKLQNVQGIWTARELKMADLRRGTVTWLDIEKIEYNVPVSDNDFTVQALRRQ